MRAKWIAYIFLCTLTLVEFWSTCQGIAVMSVDLGSEWMKIAIVSPGVPMEIALNKESKRKTPVAVAFRDGERSFGEDAANIGVRFPANAYTYLPLLIGKKVDSPAVQLYMKRFPYHKIIPDPERGTVVFQHNSDTQYSVEELLGMLLEVAKITAQEAAGDKHVIKEAVITVPGHWGQPERRAILASAQLAGIKVLQLISDHMAVALNYGIFRRKDFNETAQYIMFYDMGASSTTATVASYQLVKSKERGFLETNPQVSIIGIGYDRTLGGLEMQLRLRDYLATKFNEMGKTKTDVFGNPRSLAKLFKEAGRLKNVLSANADHYAQVEGLLEDIDFKLLVTRDQFEDLCSDLFERVKGPVERALKSSGLTMDVINQIILVGAGTRVPKVQEFLSKAVGMDLGKSLNTDEAAAMGAAYRAADLSAGFKVKKFITKDAVVFPIQVVFEREIESEDSSEKKGIKTVRRMLFGPMNPFPQKKILTFNKHTDDFTFYVSEAVPESDQLPDSQFENDAGHWMNLTEVHMAGVGSALKKTTGPGAESKGVKAHFIMNDSGILSLLHAELVVEKTLSPEEEAEEERRKEEEEANAESPLSKLGSTISKLFTGGEEKKVDNESIPESGKDEAKEDDQEKKTDDEKKADGTAKKLKDKTESKNETKTDGSSEKKKPKVVIMKEVLGVDEIRLDVPDLAGDMLDESIKKIEKLNEMDTIRRKTEGAMNSLESFVFDLQRKLDTEEYTAASTPEEIDSILKECSEVSEWISDDGAPGMGAKAQDYESRLTSLKRLSGPLIQRVVEHHGRPEAIRSLDSLLGAAEVFLSGARTSGDGATTSDGKAGAFTEVELQTLEKLISDTKGWKTKMEVEQSKLSLSVAPKLTIKAIAEKMAALDREVKYLINKIEIWKANKAREANAAKAKENKTETTSEGKNETETINEGENQQEAAKEDTEPLVIGDEQPFSSVPEDMFTDSKEDVQQDDKDDGVSDGMNEDDEQEVDGEEPENGLDEEKAHNEL